VWWSEPSAHQSAFEAYGAQVLAPLLKRGQVVVLDNLPAHMGERVKVLIDEKNCELLYLPPYWPDLDPIEEAFSKIEVLMRQAEVSTYEALIETLGVTMSAVAAQDARGYFEHCGYVTSAPFNYFFCRELAINLSHVLRLTVLLT
jgi:transposase